LDLLERRLFDFDLDLFLLFATFFTTFLAFPFFALTDLDLDLEPFFPLAGDFDFLAFPLPPFPLLN
jgi:hypothetical protein